MKIVVIGSNAAGMSFAAKYKRNNIKDEVIAFEKRDYVSFGACGLPYYVGGFFDDSEKLIARTVEQTIESGIDLRINTTVTDINFNDKYVVANGKNVSYDKLIISTGASAIIPNFGEYDNCGFCTLTSMEDGNKLKTLLKEKSNSRVLIIGGGFIGLEVLEACIKLGKSVELVEGSDAILSNTIDKELSLEILNNIDEGLIYTNKRVVKISYDQKYIVDFSDETKEYDIVVCAAGFRPNTNFINTIKKESNGAIITDKNCMTSIIDVYAIGDCALSYNFLLKKSTYTPLATGANKHGRMLADYLSNIDSGYVGMLGSSCLKLLDYEVASTGLNEKACIENKVDYSVKVIKDFDKAGYYPPQSQIITKIVYDKNTLEILGAQMIGKNGVVQRLNTLSLAIYKKVTTKELGYIDFAYAPPFSRTWDLLNVIGNVSK